MQRALTIAQDSSQYKEFPVGAVLVRNNTIIAESANHVERTGQAIEHAECRVLRIGAQVVGYRDLRDCVLFVTLEPCQLCEAACELYRVHDVIFGAYNLNRKYKSPATWVGGVMINCAESLIQDVFER